MAEEAAETEEAVAEVTAETVPEGMAENVTDEVAETEIITVKMAEILWGVPTQKIKNMDLNGLKFLEMHFKHIKTYPQIQKVTD